MNTSTDSKVCVLLATKNGASYISDMLDSMLNQKKKISKIVVSDDGSTDETRNIVTSRLSNIIAFEILEGPQLGSTQNFLSLASYQESFDFYAFADQDDIWDDDHLDRACSVLDKIDKPALVYSPIRNSLARKGAQHRLNEVDVSDFLLQNPAKGCTMVFNSEAKAVINSFSLGLKVSYHDWWCAFLVASVGRVLSFDTPSVFYREHEDQQIGTQKGLVSTFKKIVRFKEKILEVNRMIENVEDVAKDRETQKKLSSFSTLIHLSRLKFHLKFLELYRAKPKTDHTVKTLFARLLLLQIVVD
jgi:glycosyltransferase involved in cell wall biosynthesis